MDEISKALHAAQMERRNHIASSFSNLAETAAEEEAIKKARSGIYADTSENRKLGRVGMAYGRKKAEEKKKTSSGYDAQKLEHLSEDELRESAKKFGVKTRIDRNGEIFLRIESKKEVGNLKKFLHSCDIDFDETKLKKEPGFNGTHSYSYDLYSDNKENSVNYLQRKAKYIQNDIDFLTDESENHPNEKQREAAKKELQGGSLQRELEEVNKKISSLMRKSEESHSFDEDVEEKTEKSDIMYALGNGNIEITKSGKEIKEQVESVLLPELNANLAVKEAEATEKLGECGDAPTSDPDPWWTGDVKIDVGYKIYSWREMDFCKPESRMYDSLSASDEAEKKGNCPTSEAEAKARREYNDIVRAICNIRVDIKACEILKELKDNTQYKLTPRQVITLKF